MSGFWARCTGTWGGDEAEGYRVSFGGDENILKLIAVAQPNILESTELYTLNGCIVWYVNYLKTTISINLSLINNNPLL